VQYTCWSRPPLYMTEKVSSAARAHTLSRCMTKVWMQRCCPRSHTRTVWSEAPDSSSRPSALTRSARTLSVWLCRRWKAGRVCVCRAG
jgi:hypothetical protein